MWWYMYAHGAYHLNRCFPQGNRRKISAFLIFIAFLMPLPTLHIIMLENSARACDYPLINLNVISIILTFFTIGFTIIFCAMNPVPRPVKIAFHVFGVVSFMVGASLSVNTYLSTASCSYYTTELWVMSFIQSCCAVLCTVLILLMLPFWLINEAKTNLVLDPYSRRGICYGPVQCCTCLWHI